MRHHRLAYLTFILLVPLGLQACASSSNGTSGTGGVTSLTGTWVGKGTEYKEPAPFAMLIVMQEGNDGSLNAKGQRCTSPTSDALGSWISYSGQGHNSDVQGNSVDLTLIEARSPEDYYGFHGILSGTTLNLDDEISQWAPVHLTLQPGTSSDYQTLCNGIGAAAAAAATSTAQAEPTPAPLSGTWAVTESNVVCTPSSGQPASVCSGNLANYSMIFHESGDNLNVTIPASQNGMTSESLSGTIKGSQFTVIGHYQVLGHNPLQCNDQYVGTVVASNRIRGTYTTSCFYLSGAAILSAKADWTATQ